MTGQKREILIDLQHLQLAKSSHYLFIVIFQLFLLMMECVMIL